MKASKGSSSDEMFLYELEKYRVGEVKGEIESWFRVGIYRGAVGREFFCGWEWNISLSLLGLEVITLGRENGKWVISFTASLLELKKKFP